MSDFELTMQERRLIASLERRSTMPVRGAASSKFSSAGSTSASTPGLTATSTASDDDTPLTDLDDLPTPVTSDEYSALHQALVTPTSDVPSASGLLIQTAATPDVAMADASAIVPDSADLPKRMRTAPRRFGHDVFNAAQVDQEDDSLAPQQSEGDLSDAGTGKKRKQRKPAAERSSVGRSKPAVARKLTLTTSTPAKSASAADAPKPAPKPKPVKAATTGAKRKRTSIEDDAAGVSPPSKAAKQLPGDDVSEMAHTSNIDATSDIAEIVANITTLAKQPAKRKAAPRRKTTGSLDIAGSGEATTVKKPRQRKPAAPKAIVEDSDVELEAGESDDDAMMLPVVDMLDVHDEDMDPALLELTRQMAARLPVGQKPQPRGKPEVWAASRAELHETLPYFNAPQSGCHTQKGVVWGFMRDSFGSPREYMDNDVIISRAGGNMGKDDDTKAYTQRQNHTHTDSQYKAVLNNLKHQTPVYIICGDRCTDSLTAMPHKYNVLGCYKITHVWQEMNRGNKGKAMMTFKYRFERMGCDKPAWFAPAGEATPVPSSQECPMVLQDCTSCGRISPQVYLSSWTCLNGLCDKHWYHPNGKYMPIGPLDLHPGFLLHRTPWPSEEPPYPATVAVPTPGDFPGASYGYSQSRGVTCPQCGRCCNRYLYERWQCDTTGCGWYHEPVLEAVEPVIETGNEQRNRLGTGPGVFANAVGDGISVQLRYFHGYKIARYGLKEGSSLYHCKATIAINAIPGGPDDVFRALQLAKMGAVRRKLKPTGHRAKNGKQTDAPEADGRNRMAGFTTNYGTPYGFVGVGDTKPWDQAPPALIQATGMMNWALRAIPARTSEIRKATTELRQSNAGRHEDGEQISEADIRRALHSVNECMVVLYRVGSGMGWHSDNEVGLRDLVITVSLGGAAFFHVRMLQKYFLHRETDGRLVDEKPLSLEALRAAGYGEDASETAEIYERRVAAYEELQEYKKEVHTEAELKAKAIKLWKDLGIKVRDTKTVLTTYLTHGDMVIMENLQKHYEHTVVSLGNVRCALTGRWIGAEHVAGGEKLHDTLNPDDVKFDPRVLPVEGERLYVTWDD